MASPRSIRYRVTAAAAATVLGATACGDPEPIDVPALQPLSAAGDAFFTGPNFWTTPVPPDALADVDSPAYVDRLSGLAPVVTVRGFTVPVFLADSTTRRFTVAPTAPRTPPGFAVDGVPIPAQFAVDPADNGHLAVLDSATRCVYELYQPQQQDEGWTADWVNVTPADGDGTFPDGLSARSSGFASSAGLIWPEELRSGEIPHALVFAYPFTRSGGPVAPATRSDGRTVDPAALPIGAHLVLDASVDLGALGLTPAERTIAEALQRYGMILGDTSNGFSLYAVHPRSFPADPYDSTWGTVDYNDLANIPFDRMKVLPLGAQQPSYTGPPIPNRCSGPGATG